MKIWLFDDEEDIREAFSQALELEGFSVKTFASAERVIDRIGEDFDGIILSDIRMPKMDGMEILAHVQKIDKDIPLVLITGNGDIDLAVNAMKNGAYDFLTKPVSMAHLVEVARRACERRGLVLENRHLKREAQKTTAGWIGESDVAKKLQSQMEAMADLDLPVLIEGETGVGKDFVARILHQNSARKEKPFLTIPLAAMPRQTIEAELFGHVAGAFAGATRDRIGRLEHGRGGVVFLDDISSVPLDLQAKLLRVIEDNAIFPLGSNESVPLNVRFIASSKQPLTDMVKDGRFRDDLFYRLNGLHISIPPLRQRKSDIPAFFHHFVQEASIRLGKDAPEIDPIILSNLVKNEWPGNLRELRYVAEGFLHGLPEFMAYEKEQSLQALMNDFEKNIIEARLAIFDGNLKNTYESLEISRKALYEKIQKYGIKRDK